MVQHSRDTINGHMQTIHYSQMHTT